MLLPEALAGVIAVVGLYLLVARYFGRVAGLVAALALAVSPVSVAVNRDNNPDALFVLLLVVAAYVGARAVESGRLRTLAPDGARWSGSRSRRRCSRRWWSCPASRSRCSSSRRSRSVRRALAPARGRRCDGRGLGAWIAAVDLTPASHGPTSAARPNNSALRLALDYNGLGRVTGQTGGTSWRRRPGRRLLRHAGCLRLLNNSLGDQGGWLLALALVGGLSVLLAAIRSRSRVSSARSP